MNIGNFWSHNFLIFGACQAIVLIAMLALMGMMLVVVLAQWAEGDAEAINSAGYMRLQTFRVAFLLSVHNEKLVVHTQPVAVHRQLAHEINTFEEKLNSIEVREATAIGHSEEAFRAYQRVSDYWREEMKPSLAILIAPFSSLDVAKERERSAAIQLFQARADTFVGYIDDIVSHIQYNAERKFLWVKLGGAITILLTLGSTLLMVFLIRINWTTPLRDIIGDIDKVRAGDFSYRIQYGKNNELGLLCKAYNAMAENLARQYEHLETLVDEKTLELQNCNQSLEYLYQTSRRLLDSGYQRKVVEKIIAELVRLTNLEQVRLCISTSPDSYDYDLIEYPPSSRSQAKKNYTIENLRKNTYEQLQVREEEGAAGFDLFLPIEKYNEQFGFIHAHKADERPMGHIPYQLVESTVNMLSVTLLQYRKSNRDKRLILMEERAVIARELHDSLVQSLSIMKLQMAWLRKQISLKSPMETIATGLHNLQVALNETYRQLRELLTAFRLKQDKPTLRSALTNTAMEFSLLVDIPIELEFELNEYQLTPNEEIHVLQIAREALINAIKHARATNITISCQPKGGEVVVTVIDNGIGFQQRADAPHHYGMAIMQERARCLDGRIDLYNRRDGGTELVLRFVPDSRLPERNRDEVDGH